MSTFFNRGFASGFSNTYLLFIALTCLSSLSAHAEEWRLLSGTYQGVTYSSGWSFVDGQYTADVTWNLGTSATLPASGGSVLSFTTTTKAPPLVDLVNNTIDVSSLTYTSYAANFSPIASWSVGSDTPVAYVVSALGDGSYVASWTAPIDPFGNTGQVTITFALASQVNVADPGITDTGDVQKVANNIYIGNTSNGTRTVQWPAHKQDNIYLGNNAGVSGQLDLTAYTSSYFSDYLASNISADLTVAHDVVVGDIGTGSLNLIGTQYSSPGGAWHVPTKLTSDALILGKNATANGTLTLYSAIDKYLTSGEKNSVVVGDAGKGTLVLNGSLTTGNFIVAKQPNSTGAVSLLADNYSRSGGAGYLSITGNNATLSVGEHGTGSLTLDTDPCLSGSYCINTSALGTTTQVADAANHTAQVFVGRYPDGNGKVNVMQGSALQAGDILRIGLDENDAPGGIGEVVVDVSASIKTGELKVGPRGKFSETWMGNSFIGQTAANDILNQGIVNLIGMYSIPGNLVNSGTFRYNPPGGGTFTIGGDLTLQPGGTLFASYNPYSIKRYQINGAANLDGIIEVNFSCCSPGAGTFPVLTAAQGVTYGPDFNVITTGLPLGWNAQVIADGTGISIAITDTPIDLSLSLTATPASVLQGETVAYITSITNNGPNAATGVYASGTLAQCNIGNLAVGATASCTSSVKANTVGALTQTMTARSSFSDPDLSNNTRSVSTTVNAAANLSLNLTATPASVTQGGTVNYTLSVTNNGLSPATGVTATGTLPTCSIGNLATGATASCTFSVTPTVVGTLTQTMTVSGNEPDPDLSNNTRSVSTTVNSASANLSLNLTATPSSVTQGGTVIYTISITNNGPSPATGVAATGTLPTCSIGNLASFGIAFCTFTVTPSVVGTLTQTMTVSGNETDPDLSNNTRSVSVVVTDSGADLSVTQITTSTTDGSAPMEGKDLRYDISIYNNGPDSITGITNTYEFSLPVYFNGGNGISCSTTSNTVIVCNLGGIAKNYGGSVYLAVRPMAAGVLAMKVTTIGNLADPDLSNNTKSISTTVNAAANLSLNLTATPASVTQGGTVNYTLSITNNGPSPATGVTASGTLPTCTIGNLVSGATASCTSSVQANTVGTLTQSVTVSANEVDPDLSDNTQSVSTSVTQANTADLVLTMTDAPDPVRKGSKLVYTLNVLNNGPVSATNVSLKDVLPSSISFVSASTTKGYCSGKSTVTCSLGTLSSGASATVKITIKPLSTGTYSNSASVNATEADPDISNNSQSVTTTVTR